MENLDKDEKLKIFNIINEWKRIYIKSLKVAEIKWNKALLKENRYEHIRDLKQLCKLGIPANRRPKVWFSICGAAEKFNKDPFLFGMHSRIKYIIIVIDSTMRDVTRKLNENVEAVNQINRDVERTFPVRSYSLLNYIFRRIHIFSHLLELIHCACYCVLLFFIALKLVTVNQ